MMIDRTNLDTLALGQTDPWPLTANDKDVAFPRGKLVVDGVLDVHNVEASIVSLAVSDDTDTTHVTTTSRHGDHASVEVDKVDDLASVQVNLDRIVGLDRRVGVADPIIPYISVLVRVAKAWSNG